MFSGNWDPEKVTVAEFFQASLVVLEVGAMEPINQILGGICIWDLEGVSLGQAWYLTPSIAYKIMEIMTVSVEEFLTFVCSSELTVGYNEKEAELSSSAFTSPLIVIGPL